MIFMVRTLRYPKMRSTHVSCQFQITNVLAPAWVVFQEEPAAFPLFHIDPVTSCSLKRIVGLLPPNGEGSYEINAHMPGVKIAVQG